MSLKNPPTYYCSPGKTYTVDKKANLEETTLTFRRGSLFSFASLFPVPVVHLSSPHDLVSASPCCLPPPLLF